MLIEFSQGIKTFWVYLKALLEKLFQNLQLSLERLLENGSFQSTIFHLFKSYASLFAKGIFKKWFILNKVCIVESMFENKFQTLFL
jgi:hypothetical protein